MRPLFLLIFCLFAFPCQAENFPCVLLGAPCYIKSNPIILREKPSFDAKIIEKFHPAKDGEWGGYYLADVFPKDGKPIVQPVRAGEPNRTVPVKDAQISRALNWILSGR